MLRTKPDTLTLRYSMEKHSTGWAVYDHTEGRFIETWLTYDEAQDLLDELGAPEEYGTDDRDEYERCADREASTADRLYQERMEGIR